MNSINIPNQGNFVILNKTVTNDSSIYIVRQDHIYYHIIMKYVEANIGVRKLNNEIQDILNNLYKSESCPNSIACYKYQTTIKPNDPHYQELSKYLLNTDLEGKNIAILINSGKGIRLSLLMDRG